MVLFFFLNVNSRAPCPFLRSLLIYCHWGELLPCFEYDAARLIINDTCCVQILGYLDSAVSVRYPSVTVPFAYIGYVQLMLEDQSSFKLLSTLVGPRMKTVLLKPEF